MAVIVKTKPMNDHIAVVLDNDETMRIPYRVAGMYSLAAGREVDQTEYSQLKNESERYRCGKMALDYLAIRSRTAVEMERYLGRKGFDREQIRETVTGIEEAGYIDDADYAVRYIKSKLSRKTVGKNLIASELHKKGIPKNIIRQALKESQTLLANFDDVYNAAAKKYAVLKHKTKPYIKLAFFLKGRGFDSDMIKKVVERIRSEEGGEEEYQ